MEKNMKKKLLQFLTDMLQMGTVNGFKHFSMIPQGREELSIKMTQSGTIFLLAGYARYNSPYLWLRSDNPSILMLTKTESADHPLNLQSVSKWKQEAINPWDIIGEVVKLTLPAFEVNPFAIDVNYFNSLDNIERYLGSAATINCLQKILMVSSKDSPYFEKVSEDIYTLTKLHFQELEALTKSNSVPILKQYLDYQSVKSSKTQPVHYSPSLSPSTSDYSYGT